MNIQKETPLLFKPDMVLATLEGEKTKTRRLSGLEDVNTYPGQLTGQSALGPLGYRGLMASDYYLKRSYKKDFAQHPGHYHWFLGERVREDGVKELNPIPVKCPYGGVGDLLWVRETWDGSFNWNIPGGTLQMYAKDTPKEHRTKRNNRALCYRATCNHETVAHQWMPSIFMPRWASRITLEVLSVRVEHVQEITIGDAIDEGVGFADAAWDGLGDGLGLGPNKMIIAFSRLWDSINAERGYSWAANPFVWVIDFRVVK